MNPFYRPQVTDELLSAYIDGDVTAEEKNLVERAVKTDGTVAWRLESLQQTVSLLRSLPEVALPRSFVLTEADVAPVRASIPPLASAARRLAKPRRIETENSGFWQSFVDFLQGGSPLLRNMAATGLAVWLMLFGATLLNPSRLVMPASTRLETIAAANAPVAQATPAAVNEVAIVNTQNDSPSITAVEQNQPEAQSEPAQLSATVETQPQVAQLNDTTAAKTLSAPSASSDSGNDLARTQLQSAPAALAVDGSQSGTAADPLAEAMSDPGGEMAAAPLTFAANAAEVSAGNDISMASASMANADPAAVSASEAAPVADAQVASTAVEAYAVEAPAESTVTAESTSVLLQEPAPVAAEPVAQQVAEPQAVSAKQSAPELVQEKPIQEEVVQEEPQKEEPAQNQEAQTIAPTVEVALAQPVAASIAVESAARERQLMAEPIATPYLDPMRIQIAQVTIALVTALLALFWLASQRGKRRSK